MIDLADMKKRAAGGTASAERVVEELSAEIERLRGAHEHVVEAMQTWREAAVAAEQTVRELKEQLAQARAANEELRADRERLALEIAALRQALDADPGEDLEQAARAWADGAFADWQRANTEKERADAAEQRVAELEVALASQMCSAPMKVEYTDGSFGVIGPWRCNECDATHASDFKAIVHVAPCVLAKKETTT